MKTIQDELTKWTNKNMPEKKIIKPRPKTQSKKPKKKKEEKIDWADLMGMRRPTYRRNRGAMRQK
ncbi:hypothetical protein [Pseudalkalibacillus caeni]|uniref:Uncharacterized protein n=1 Tax=Exobacillus caeni TaxID=2574798 RepID=A0A5R9F423_9BACL|nr:hypothetical protein [Pseudalkalibacillus caeni]TLS37751.1 hypothetical protein FCL54_07985 [Pseudalkalibacillus caeni]